MKTIFPSIAALALAGMTIGAAAQQGPPAPMIAEADYVVPEFRFHTGETLAGMKIHYATLGTPKRDAQGHISNAILLLHGTGGTGRGMASGDFASAVFGPGQVFDTTRYFIVLPDAIGHGRTAKPSDGLKVRFPKYDYRDMVDAQHALAEHLGIQRFELVGGQSMGCMHSWTWATAYPEAMKRVLALACTPTEIAGRNRLTRKMAIESIRNDPAYQGGNYATPPLQGLRAATFILSFSNTTAAVQQRQFPTRAAADAEVDRMLKAVPDRDANDMIYQFDASRDYNPEPDLAKIRAKILWINSADDLVNAADAGEVARMAAKLAPGQFMMIPTGPETVGHGTTMKPKLWGDRVADLMRE
ncbi:MAG: alpha/beta fold hydrolase [Sphingomonas sp.]|jgi:homoserine O-acetyltransferase|uniref:alpha/beta fold hydrolase n=1 Tax=Sphingomonas sp. TaxID=28214 RepID=UPI003568CA4D